MTHTHRKALLLVAAVTVIAWGSAGFYQGLNSGFSGGLYDPEYMVPGVFPGSAAEKAGFRAGDRVVSVEGIPIEDLSMESRWPRSLAVKPGHSLRFVVERKSERIPINFTYDGPSRRAVNNRIGAVLTGLAFLLPGL